jgi:hypothetical protein
MMVAWQFTAWNGCKKGIRPVGARFDLGIGIVRGLRQGLPQLIKSNRLYETVSCARVPGNKLPGYLHSIPTGRNSFAPDSSAKRLIRFHLARLHNKNYFRRLLRLKSASVPISEYFTGDEPGPSYQLFDPGSR